MGNLNNLFSQVTFEWRSAYLRDMAVNLSMTRMPSALRQMVCNPQCWSDSVEGSLVESAYLRILRVPHGAALAPQYSFDALVHGHDDHGLSDLSADALAAVEVQREAIWSTNRCEEMALAAAIDVLDAPGTVSGVVLQLYDPQCAAINGVFVVGMAVACASPDDLFGLR